MEPKNNLSTSLLESIPALKRRKAGISKINQITYIAEQLQDYQAEVNIEINANETQIDNIIEFGFWIKDKRNLSNSSVVTYLNVILSHLRDTGTEVIRRKIIKSFPYSQANIPVLSEDLIQAILATNVEDRHRHVLDAIKLIILHGFRYSDFWVLEKDNCIFETKNGVKYFKYFPPKNRNSTKNRDKGVSVALHPIGERIIDFWKDLRTYSVWNENRAPKYFKDKKLYPHIDYRKGENIQPYFVFERPIIKIPHHFLDKSVKKAIFTEIHRTWLNMYHYQIKYLDPKNSGLMSIVPGAKQLWETLSYHTFRHVYCSRFLAKGGTVVDLRDNVGHSSIAVTQKYAHTNEAERIERSVNVMDF